MPWSTRLRARSNKRLEQPGAQGREFQGKDLHHCRTEERMMVVYSGLCARSSSADRSMRAIVKGGLRRR
jgi:hypothetical protein